MRLAAVVAGGLALSGAALRLVGAPQTPDTFDEVSFLAALEGYDLLAFEPHFPGYPLAVLLARAAAGLGAPAPYAAASAALLLLAAWRLHEASRRGWGGALAVGLFALAPVAVVEGARPMADGVATGLLALGLAEAWRAWSGRGDAALAALGLGAAAAAKPDLLPFAACLPGLLWPLSRRRRALAAAAFACPLLFAALALTSGCGGPTPALAEAQRFLTGHLTDWGGGALTAASSQPRVLLAGAPLAEASGASGAALPLAALGLAVLAVQAPRATRRAALVACLPYGVWALFGQNLEHPRHMLPLLPPLAWLAGLGVSRIRAAPALRAGLALALVLGAASGALREQTLRSARGRPSDQLLATLEREDPLRTRIYTAGRGRALRWRRPDLDVRRVRSLEAALADLAADPTPPPRLLVTSDVPDAATLPLAHELGQVDLHSLGLSQ